MTAISRPVIYLAHPVAPTAEEITEARAMLRAIEHELDDVELRRLATRTNVIRAQEILNALRREFRDVVFTAPWIACMLDSDEHDDDAETREAGPADNEELVKRCDGIALTGTRMGVGSTREEAAGRQARGAFTAYDLVGVIALANDVPKINRSCRGEAGHVEVTFDAWASHVGRVEVHPGAPPWRPIATAPRDGSLLLISNDAGDLSIGRWHGAVPTKCPSRWRDTEGWGIDDATHWMPLPELP